MKALYVNHHAKHISETQIDVVEKVIPYYEKDECLIKVVSSGINPSDALATTGYFKHAVVPRIPGRDFAGMVVEGPAHLVGKSVWGTGGAAGISFDGTQAEYIKLSAAELAEIPNNMDTLLAGAQLLPYVTAYYSLVKRAQIKQQETVLVMGALGQVGRAAMSICQWKNCRAIALVQNKEDAASAAKLGWTVINTDESDLHEKILAANHGQPVQVILNSVGNVYWQDYMSVLAEFGRIVTIGAREQTREVMVNLFDLYRANQEIIGVNTVSFDFADNAKLLNELKVGFEEKKLVPLSIDPSMIYSPEQAVSAYQQVMTNTAGKRIVIRFE